jgi:hypothetical protein
LAGGTDTEPGDTTDVDDVTALSAGCSCGGGESEKGTGDEEVDAEGELAIYCAWMDC